MIIVFDIDGTLANIEHRRHYVASKPKNWKAFNAGMKLDTPHDDIIYLFHILRAAGHMMLIASGRGREDEIVTVETLQAFDTMPTVDDGLYMRNAKDSRPDWIVKGEILDKMISQGRKPDMVFDDRKQVVDMWRERGIRCLQVAPGDF